MAGCWAHAVTKGLLARSHAGRWQWRHACLPPPRASCLELINLLVTLCSQWLIHCDWDWLGKGKSKMDTQKQNPQPLRSQLPPHPTWLKVMVFSFIYTGGGWLFPEAQFHLVSEALVLLLFENIGYIFLLFWGLDIEPKASCMLSKHFTTSLPLTPLTWSLNTFLL